MTAPKEPEDRMQEHDTDVLVIGSGVGGLATGARLAAAGLAVTVVERMARVGGRASSEERGGFFIPTGAIGIEAGGIIERTFAELELELPIVRPPYPQVAYRIRGQDVYMPEKGGLKIALEAAADDAAEAQAVHDLIIEAMSSAEHPATTVDEWLGRATTNPDVLGIFRRMIPAIHGINSNEMPVSEFIGFLVKMRGYREYGYARGGTISIAAALADHITRHGGRVLLSTSARELEIVDGRVRSVTIQPRGEQPTRVVPKAVVSNIGPRATVKIAGTANLPSDYVGQIDSMKPPVPLLAIFYASEDPVTDFHGMLIPTRTRCLNIAIQPTHLVPELAPSGRHLLMTMAAPPVTDMQVDWKAMEADCLADAEDLFPGIHDHTEVLVKLHFHGEWPVIRSWAGDDAPHSTPVDNLFLVGDGAKPSGFAALPACFEGARLVAGEILGSTARALA